LADAADADTATMTLGMACDAVCGRCMGLMMGGAGCTVLLHDIEGRTGAALCFSAGTAEVGLCTCGAGL
jgi:hypothetical protein